MDFSIDEDQELLRETFSTFFEKESPPERVRAAEPLGFDADLWRQFTALGSIGMGVPAPLGSGAGLLEMALVAEPWGYHLAPVPFIEGAVAARLLARSEEAGKASRAALRDIVAGSSVATLALHRVRRGESQLVPAAAIAHAVLALDGETLVLASGGKPLRAPKNLGSAPLARWSPADATERVVLASGARARELHAVAVDEWKLLTAMALVGLAAHALEMGAEYARTREQFGAAIGSYQGIAHRLADVATALDGARLLAWKAIWAREEGLERAPALASMAFSFAAETAGRVVATSLHVHGGYGFTLEYDVQLFFRRAKAWALVYDDPRAELQRVADRLYGSVAPA